jgi:hypothetical protein
MRVGESHTPSVSAVVLLLLLSLSPSLTSWGVDQRHARLVLCTNPLPLTTMTSPGCAAVGATAATAATGVNMNGRCGVCVTTVLATTPGMPLPLSSLPLSSLSTVAKTTPPLPSLCVIVVTVVVDDDDNDVVVVTVI